MTPPGVESAPAPRENATLLLGSGPLSTVASELHTGQGLRTEQFALALASAGQGVELLLIDPESSTPPTPAIAPNVRIHRLDLAEAKDAAALRRRLDGLAPRALVGASTFPSFLLAQTAHPAPLWVDLNGDPLAEGQALSLRTGDDFAIERQWWMLSSCLRRGDHFSAVSERQRHALLGQLGAAGRLSGGTAAHPWVDVVPLSCPLDAPEIAPPDGPLQFLFSGSLNSWCDDQLLLRAFALALRSAPEIVLHWTGAPIPGMEASWRAVEEAARSRELAGKLHLHGKIPSDELSRIEALCTVGVVPELELVERRLGGQNRALRWLARGLALITTTQCELASELAEHGLASVYPAGEADALAARLVELANDRTRARELGRRAREWVRRNYSIEATTAPLREWASVPVAAPDRASGTARRLARRLAEITISQLDQES